MADVKLPKSCVDCKHHDVVNDRDPDDWFNDDDCAVLCKLSPNKKKEPGNRWEFRSVTSMCRPYKTREETTPIPKWCPLTKK